MRRIAACLGGLPMGYWPDADHPASWSATDHLLATLVDCVRELTWVTASANSKGKVERPKPLYRPGSRSATRESPTPAKHSWTDFVRQLRHMEAGDG